MADFVTTANAFRTRLEQFQALPLYWPNDDREPTLQNAPAGFVFSELRLLDEGPVTIGADGERKHRDTGEFTVIVYVPRGTRAGVAEGHVQAIRNLFTISAVPGVHITRRIIGAAAIAEGAGAKYWAVPLFIQYFTDRTE